MKQPKNRMMAGIGLFSLMSLAAPSAIAQDTNEAKNNSIQNRVVATSGPIQASATAALESFGEKCETVYTVPGGSRLTLEYASVTVSLPSGQMVRHVHLVTTLGGKTVYHKLKFTPTGVLNETVAGEMVKLYADGASNVNMCVGRTPAGMGGNFYPAISGTLTPAN